MSHGSARRVSRTPSHRGSGCLTCVVTTGEHDKSVLSRPLTARLSAGVATKSVEGPGMSSTPPLTGRVRFADFELDLDSGELRRDDRFVPLQRQVARMLVILVSRGGYLVPRDELIQHLWADSIVEYDLGLNNTLRTLRRILGDDARSPRFVETVPRRGHRFIAPVESAAVGVAAGAVGPLAAGAAGSDPAIGAARRLFIGRLSMLATSVALVVALAGPWLAPAAKPRLAPTVAVLPFSGTGPNADILGASLAEELTRELAVAPSGLIRVIGATSVARAFREEPEIEAVAKRLGATHLVLGSLVNRGESLSLEIRIVRAEDRTVSWKEAIAPDLTEILTAQRRLARHIAGRVGRSIGGPVEPVERTLPISPALIADYLQGRHLVTRGSVRDAIPLLEGVVGAEPGFVPARIALGEALLMADDLSAAQRASRLASQALVLAPGDPHAHLLRAKVALCHDWEWDTAERHLSRALELAPGEASVHLARAIFFGSLGRHPEAIAAAERAQELDPLSSVVQGDLAMLRYWGGDWDGVTRESRRLLELSPDAGNARSLLLEALLRQQRWQEARGLAILLAGANMGLETVEGPKIGPRFLALQQARWETAAPSALRSMVLATLAVEQGREDDAIRLLQDAVRQRSSYVPFLAVDPHFRPLAKRSEFRRLLGAVRHPLVS